ncbi:NAD(P)-dependent oxidoreductase [Parafrankia sp. FMc2]|uniref:NAD(P)-dependent oxidoreductase n=1 Tax=Parafrankia sp. FMc2 TaxID=3233196 RepID=UPI0034D5F445
MEEEGNGVNASGQTDLAVGFVGLGNQGAPIARRIVDAGFSTTLWARRPSALEPFAGAGAKVAGSLVELGASSEVVGVCVLDDAAVEEVVAGPGGVLEGMRAGGIVMVHSTVHPETCVRLGEVASSRGITVVDAPVSGGRLVAEAGRLLVMVGGDEPAVARVRPVLATFGNPVLHLGMLGAGQRAKLLNNLTLTANLAVAEGAFALAAQLDVDPDMFAQVLAHGSGNSTGAKMLRPESGYSLAAMRDTAGPLLCKDARLAAELAAAAGADALSVFAAADTALESMGYPRSKRPRGHAEPDLTI